MNIFSLDIRPIEPPFKGDGFDAIYFPEGIRLNEKVYAFTTSVLGVPREDLKREKREVLTEVPHFVYKVIDESGNYIGVSFVNEYFLTYQDCINAIISDRCGKKEFLIYFYKGTEV